MIHVDDALWFLMEKDPGLTPYSGEIRMHMDRYNDRRWHLAGNCSRPGASGGRCTGPYASGFLRCTASVPDLFPSETTVHRQHVS